MEVDYPAVRQVVQSGCPVCQLHGRIRDMGLSSEFSLNQLGLNLLGTEPRLPKGAGSYLGIGSIQKTHQRFPVWRAAHRAVGAAPIPYILG